MRKFEIICEKLYILKVKLVKMIDNESGFMMKVFYDSQCASYETQRFCSAADRNVMLSVETRETRGDGSEISEIKTCRHADSCKMKDKCRYSQTK